MSPDATGNPFIGKQTLTNLLDTQSEKISLADLLLCTDISSAFAHLVGLNR